MGYHFTSLGVFNQKKEVLGRYTEHWSPQAQVGIKNGAAVTEQFGSSSKQKTGGKGEK
jgi:hypothetical protein